MYPSREEAQDETAGQEAEGTPLEVWICYDRNVPGAYYVFQWDTLAEKYGYEIEVETYSEQELRDKLKMAVVCNELPDIFYCREEIIRNICLRRAPACRCRRSCRTPDFRIVI